MANFDAYPVRTSNQYLLNNTLTKPVEEDLKGYFQDYDMSHRNRQHIAYIFNNEYFDEPDNFCTRTGSSEDRDSIETALKEIGLQEGDIKIFNNLTVKEMEEVLENFDKNHPDPIGSFICVIMTHGVDDKLYGCDGRNVKVDTLIEYLTPNNCKSLKEKPKLFFIEACRGHKIDSGAERRDADRANACSLTIPLLADLLVVYSSCKDYTSLRTSTGSWFIQTLSDVLKRYGLETDILRIVTAICNYVSTLKYETGDNKPFKQMPCCMSTLTKRLMFQRN